MPGLDLRDTGLPAAAVIHALGLKPHPEGGHYRETWRDPAPPGERGAGTAILFLLAAGQGSHWHRVDAAELWLWHAGAPLMLRLSPDGRSETTMRLGPDLAGGDALQGVVPRDTWQAAATEGAWTLCSCVVAPAFRFEGFTLAASDWAPG